MVLDRYRVFHQIVTQCDLSSADSIIRASLTELMRELHADRGAYLAVSSGGLRCLMARTSAGSELVNEKDDLPWEFLQKVPSSGQHYAAKMPITPRGSRGLSSSYSRFEIKNMLCVPTLHQGRVVGVGYLERGAQQPSFVPSEIQSVTEIFQDIEVILGNSWKVQRQSFEIDQMKDEIAMSKINMISQHATMLRLFKQITKVAKVPSTVLIHGESGTGKELVGRAIYNLSGSKGPYISMNCGAIEQSLMKSELFGHLKGSFTSAHRDREGLFKKAENGILFMDEVGEMPLDIQVTLLRTLELGEILPVGSDQPQIVKTRVIAATHRDLAQMTSERTFRNDLYQRLHGITLEVPPLRDRKSDIPLLAENFVKTFNSKLGLNYKGFRSEALALLMDRDYRDGNVRELKHLIERAMVFEDDPDLIGPEFLGDDIGFSAKKDVVGSLEFEEQINEYARQVIESAIEACGGNKTKAMKRLGLARTTFYSMLSKYGITG